MLSLPRNGLQGSAMDTGLQDKHILITGASGGIGQAVARAFAACGTRLLLHYHTNRPSVEALCGELNASARPLQADLRDEDSVVALFQEALAAAGPIDGVVVNAGIWPEDDVAVADMTVQRWRATIDADLFSAFLTCREYLRHLARVPRRQASIVLIGSTAALFGEAGHADYAAAKAAVVHGLTLTLKNEIVRLAPEGRVNCVCPGWTDTPMSAAALQDPGAVARATATMPMRKIARPEDVAGAVVMLSSPLLAGHISGAILPIAGGMEGRIIHGF
jgi:NAD(P)-dependent dehydrogenase (short-subunit alcohol dehydrogenase family)